MTHRSFNGWLKRQSDRKCDAIGDLARDILKDDSWPNTVRNNYGALASYLETKDGDLSRVSILYNAWCEWSAAFYGEIRPTTG